MYDFGVDGDYSYIVMRHIEGSQSLSDLIRQSSLTHEQALDLIDQIAKALTYAHKHGVIHRDVKPSNILIDDDWVLLSDFGLAKVSQATTKLTGSHIGMGTPSYMSPEQGRGEKIDQRTDIYALGIMLFEMLTGQVPHKAETPLGTVMKRINEPLPMPRSLNPDIPEAVERVLLKALAVDPNLRFDSAGEMAAALEAAYRDRSDKVLADVTKEYVAPGEKTAVPPVEVTKPELIKKPEPKSSLPINIFGFGAIGALIVLVLCGLGVLIALQLWPERSPVTWEYILDLSTGMNQPFPGESISKWEATQTTLADDLALVPEEINVGLRVFGQGEGAKSCTETSLLVEPNPKQAPKIQDKLAGLSPAGSESPLTEAMVQAFNDLELAPDKRNALIILTTGGDSCDPEGVEQISTLVQRLNVRVDTYIVGLAIEEPFGVFVAQPDYQPNLARIIEPGMVLELEPPAIRPDFKKGATIGSPVLVTDTGCRLLSKNWKPEVRII